MRYLAVALVTVRPGQVLAGKAFGDLASRADAICPTRTVRSITPGDLDYAEANFINELPRRARLRLRSANKAERRCAGHNGLACPSTATLVAMARIGATKRFVRYICSHPNPR